MKSKLMSTLVISMLTTSALTSVPVFAHGGKESDHDSATHEASALTSDSSPTEVMAQIRALEGRLAMTISEKKLSEVHDIAFAIRDLAATLPAKASDEKKARVEGSSKNIAAIASALDASGDARDQARTEANQKKLNSLVKLLEGQVIGKK